jgi:fucose permease
MLADRFGLKVVILLAGFFLLVGVFGYSSLASAWLLAGSLFIVGLGLGALELGPNAIIVAVHPERKGLFLNLMSVMHGMGSMLAPLLAGAALAAGLSWRLVYRWDLWLVLAFVVYFLIVRFPPMRQAELAPLSFQEIPRFAFGGALPWFYLSMALYVAAEIGMASWLVAYLQDVRLASIETSNQALSIFFGTMMVGRFLGSFVVHRVGYLRSVLFSSLAALACIILGLLGPAPLAFLLPFTGFFFSIIFPTLTAAVSDLHTGHDNTVLGVLFTFAGIGGLLGPWLVAWSSELLGLQLGFAMNLALAVLLSISLGVLLKGRNYEPQTA